MKFQYQFESLIAAQVESSNKMKDDAIKQARKIQSQLKDYQRELDEAKTGKDDLIAAAKEAEKKLKANEAEMAQVCAGVRAWLGVRARVCVAYVGKKK